MSCATSADSPGPTRETTSSRRASSQRRRTRTCSHSRRITPATIGSTKSTFAISWRALVATQVYRQRVSWNSTGAVRRSFARNVQLRRSVIAGMVPRVEMFSPGGIYLGDAPAIHFERTRVYPSLEKMVRGLYRHHTGRLLPRDARFSWGLNEMFYGIRAQTFQYATPGLQYGDVFESRFIVEHENDLEIVAWWRRFYQWTVFRCFI